MTFVLHHGDCLEVLPTLEADSVDTCITDPPYGLEFMGKDWDHGVPGVRFWREVYRVLKPGAMLLAFGGTRTHHRLMVAIEDAGFEIRDCLMWLYGSGFPKSYNIGQSLQKKIATGKARRPDRDLGGLDRNRWSGSEDGKLFADTGGRVQYTHEEAARWDGWGTALKPAWEPIILAMKPRAGTFAENALAWGVAGLNIDGARIATDGHEPNARANKAGEDDTTGYNGGWKPIERTWSGHNGRWPANVVLDGEAARLLDEMSGESTSTARPRYNNANNGTVAKGVQYEHITRGHADTGGASRFFYCAKASRSERNAGLEGLPKKAKPLMGEFKENPGRKTPKSSPTPRQNHHPTVKPLSLMRWLCRLTKTPTGGVVLDPFAGSGSTGCAAIMEGREFIGIELDADYYEIAERRIAHAAKQPRQLTLEEALE